MNIRILCALALAGAGGPATSASADTDPWADQVVAFDAGTGGASGFDDPAAALGEPSRMTGFASPDAEVVSPFVAPFHASQIVSIGSGGSLTVLFAEPVADDPANPFGIDLLIFGNTFFTDAGGGACGSPCGTFTEGGVIEVSADGETWFEVPGAADGPWPTNGWADLTDPFSSAPGMQPSDFSRPVDPTITLEDFAGLDYQQMQSLYDGSGGGVGIDLADVGLAFIHYVRISNPAEFDTPEIDAFADVRPVYPSDVTGDGIVGLADLLAILAAWGTTGEPGTIDEDTNDDGTVGLGDLLNVLSDWGAGG